MLARAFYKHDHDACRDTALQRAAALCAEHDLQFTPMRRRVLDILLEKHRALGAYDIIDVIKQERAVQPPTVYRALDFLVKYGLAHRIERMNAFVACTHDHGSTSAIFLICEGCGRVAETGSSGLDAVLRNVGRDQGFTARDAAMEVVGLCPACTD